jgi:uncharacterized membrane protein
MSVDVQSAIVINRRVSEVSRYAADPDNAPLWYVNIKSVEWATPRPAQVGSRIAFVANFLGRRLAYTYDLVEFVPGVRLVMRTSEGPFPMETTYTWESNAEGATRMTLRHRHSFGFSAWVAPLIGMAMRRANRKDLALLKKRLEGSTHDPPMTYSATVLGRTNPGMYSSGASWSEGREADAQNACRATTWGRFLEPAEPATLGRRPFVPS